KKIVCEFFKTGSCYKFDACPFSHDLKLEPCRFFHLNNNCKEANCPYSHDPL
ncbi:CCCH-type zinc finger transcription factor, partial [Mucor lusitanicus CBS 277.49]